MPRKIKQFGCGLGLLLLLGLGHGLFTAARAKFTGPDTSANIPKELPNDPLMLQYSDRFALMAWFAEIVYRRELIDDGTIDSACDYQRTGAPPSDWGMPRPQASRPPNEDLGGEPEESGDPGRWSRYVSKNKGTEEEKASEACVNKKGLFYETYVFEQDGQVKRAVLAFRGTENREREKRLDWSTNLSASLGMEPKQYKFARKKLGPLIDELSTHPEIEIYATGHSLGGGLAQQAGYLFPEIKAVYTFNTSPITNWSRLRLKTIKSKGGTATKTGLIRNDYPTIYRVYHTGEALHSIRNVVTTFTTTRYRRYDIGVQLRPKELVGGHSQAILACDFARIFHDNNGEGKDAKFDFFASYIEEKVLAEGGCCNDSDAPNSVCG